MATPALDPLLLKLLKGDREQRYAKIGEFLCDLETFEAGHKLMELRSHSVYDFPEFTKQFQDASAALDAGDLTRAFDLSTDLSQKVPRASEVLVSNRLRLWTSKLKRSSRAAAGRLYRCSWTNSPARRKRLSTGIMPRG